MNDTILAAVRGTEASDAVALATVLAEIYGRRLVIAGICVLPSGAPTYRYDHALREQLRHELGGLGTRVPGDLEVERLIREGGSPIEGFHDVVDEQDPAAVVVGPDHLCALTRGTRGDPGLGLTRDISSALAVAPHGYAERDFAIPRLIGVGWEPTEEARVAVRGAIELATHVDGSVRLIHVVPDARGPAALCTSDTEDVLAQRHHDATRDLESVAAALDSPVPVEVQVLHGDPAHVLSGASGGVDVMVLGSRGYGSPGRTMLGNISAAVLPRAACPVIVLPRSLVTDPLDTLPAAEGMPTGP